MNKYDNEKLQLREILRRIKLHACRSIAFSHLPSWKQHNDFCILQMFSPEVHEYTAVRSERV